MIVYGFGFAEATTDKLVTYDYLVELGLVRTYTGFDYSTFVDENEQEEIFIIYSNDNPEGYAVVCIKYVRLHYSLILNTSVGVQTFVPNVKDASTITQLPDQYRVYYQASFELQLDMYPGYRFLDFVVTAQESQGSESLGTTEAVQLELREDGYYYGDKLILSFVANDETGYYDVIMAPYDITITTQSEPIVYTFTYHRYINEEDEETFSEEVTFNTAYTIYYPSNIKEGWSKLGYDIATGEKSLKTDYTADFLQISVGNRAGDIYRRVIFKDMILSKINGGMSDLDYTSMSEPMEMEITFKSDWWKDEVA